MQQLPLDISAPEPPSFDNYVAGANAEALAAVRALGAGANSANISAQGFVHRSPPSF